MAVISGGDWSQFQKPVYQSSTGTATAPGNSHLCRPSFPRPEGRRSSTPLMPHWPPPASHVIVKMRIHTFINVNQTFRTKPYMFISHPGQTWGPALKIIAERRQRDPDFATRDPDFATE
ncbi:uncharacterized protein BBA_08531 [Beauveria bassiana ARSEF 2860]|uniref:Uncharacterized protein n=1 Tax=Beauveria bassiana (strain ARSEF 2860) TaxID=655819 RepID=J4UH69_BEAB2|nr:uncharacterized protein BBA_08531 [Beauveria bassiana ARSEF 2860]EJP62447.1 hypothetical protein BBA_08531 [Beauveria bassiana ARSEF 2860]